MPQFTSEYWSDTESRVEFFPTSVPPNLPVTAVKIYVFEGNKLLLTDIKSRGWDLPGGHIEPGESPEEAVIRELKEETGATIGHFDLIGYLKITNEKENERNHKYPKASCILVYKGEDLMLDEGHHFELEASASRLVLVDELPEVHHDWNEHKAQVIAYASAART